MKTNQSQIKDLYFADPAEANNAVAYGKVCFIESLKSWFYGVEIADAANNVDIVDSLDAGVKWVKTGGSGLLKGPFSAAAKYRTGDYVVYENRLYRATVDMVVVTPPKPTQDATMWSLEVGFLEIPAFDKTEDGIRGELVTYQGKLYQWSKSYDSGTVREFYQLYSTGYFTSLNTGAPDLKDYDPDSYYFPGEVVVYQGKLKRCKQLASADKAGVFNSAKWEDFLVDLTPPKVWNTLPVIAGEIRLYNDIYLIKAVTDIPEGHTFGPQPVNAEYEFYSQLKERFVTPSDTLQTVAGSTFIDEFNTRWKAEGSELTQDFSYGTINSNALPLSVCNSIHALPTSRAVTFPEGFLILHNSNVLRCNETHAVSDVVTAPMPGKWDLYSLSPMHNIQKLFKADTLAFNTAAAGSTYLSPDQHGGVFGTVYRIYLNQLTDGINTILSSLTNLKVIDSCFHVSTWVADNRGVGTASFTELVRSSNWPSDVAFRVRAIVETAESEKNKLKVQQGASVRVESGWIDFTTTSGAYKDFADLLE